MNVYLAYRGQGDSADMIGVFDTVKAAKQACGGSSAWTPYSIEEWKLNEEGTGHIWSRERRSENWVHRDCNIGPLGKVIEDEETE